MKLYVVVLALITLGSRLVALRADEPKLLDVADVKRDAPVEFERDVLPLLKKNCIACHNATTAENKLVVETPSAMLKGGDAGPAIVIGKGLESLLLLRARGGGDGPMPPPENKVGAVPLSADELGLIRLWIDQGAKGGIASATKIEWRSLPSAVNPIFAVALTGDGQFAACNRANQVFVYQVPTGREVCRLTDPGLQATGLYPQSGVADLDLVQSLAFSPDGQLLATGGFQTVKLWQRPQPTREASMTLGGAARALAVSADEKRVAVATEERAITLFELPEMKAGPVLTGHEQPIVAVRFSADGALVYSAAADGVLRAWQTATGQPAWQLATGVPTAAMVVIGTGPQLATGGADGKVRIWNPPADPAADAKPQAVAELSGHTKPVTALLALASQPGQVRSAGEDGLLIVWDIAAKKALGQVNHGASIAAMAMRGDGQQFASVGVDKIARLWNVADGKELAKLSGTAAAIAGVSFAQRSLELARNAVADDKATLAELEKAVTTEAAAIAKAGEAKTAAEKTHAEKQAAAKKAGDENTAAIAAVEAAKVAEKQATDAKTAAEAQITQATAAQPVAMKAGLDVQNAANADKANAVLAEAAEKFRQAAASVDEKLKQAQIAQAEAVKQIAAAAAQVKQLSAESAKKVDAVAAAQKAVEDAAAPIAAADRAASLATAAKTKAEERVTATKQSLGTAEQSLKQAEAAVAAAGAALTASAQPLTAVAFSPDGAELAVADSQGAIHTWSTATGAPLATYAGHPGGTSALAYIAVHRLLSAGADKTIGRWSMLGPWPLVRTIGGPTAIVDRVATLDFTPDGQTLVTGSGAASRSGELKMWRVADGALVREIASAHSDTVLSARFSPDGALLATGAADKFVKLFESATGKFVRAFEGHTHHVLGVAWRSDGKLLASAGADNAIKVWEVASGEQKRSITGFSKEVTSLAFVGTGSDILATSGDKSVRIKRSSDGADVRSFAGPTDFVYSAAASADGKVVIAGGQDSVLRVWNGENAQTIRNFDPPPVAPPAAQAQR